MASITEESARKLQHMTDAELLVMEREAGDDGDAAYFALRHRGWQMEDIARWRHLEDRRSI